MLLTFASLQDPPLFLTASLADDAWEEQAVEISLTDWETPGEASAPAIDSAIELVSLVDFAVEAPEVTEPLLVEPLLRGELPSDARQLMAPAGGAAGDEASGSAQGAGGDAESPAPPGKVRFFGAESAADRVVFVVDNSGSMQRGRMETTLIELDRAVRRLSHSQSFYVIFYSDQAYPMFFPDPIDEMLPATRENKKRLSKWLGSVEMCLGGRLLDAVEMAATLEPEVVFLLSDGDIRSPRVMAKLTEPDAWGFTINASGMGARNKNHAANLAAIAEANGGAFTFVDAHPKAVMKSLTRPLPYHRQPGETWGSAVRPWN